MYHLEVGESGKRKLSITNKIPDVKICEKAVEKANESLSKPRDNRVLDRSPGGTGLARIKALLTPVSRGGVHIEVHQGPQTRDFTVSVSY